MSARTRAFNADEYECRLDGWQTRARQSTARNSRQVGAARACATYGARRARETGLRLSATRTLRLTELPSNAGTPMAWFEPNRLTGAI